MKRGPDALKRRFWTADELAIVAEMYPDRGTAVIAHRLGRSTLSVYNAAHNLGLKKSAAFFASDESGVLRKGETRPESIAHQFPKGHVPANKGLRRPGFAPGRMRETQFRKGARTGMAARNWKPIGTILTDADGYLRIKIREAVHGAEATGFGNTKVWPLYQRYVWEQHKGPIPPGQVVVFKDRQRANCAFENLELISRGDLARRNAMWNRFPKELIAAIQANGVLKRKLRSQHGAEQNQ